VTLVPAADRWSIFDHAEFRGRHVFFEKKRFFFLDFLMEMACPRGFPVCNLLVLPRLLEIRCGAFPFVFPGLPRKRMKIAVFKVVVRVLFSEQFRRVLEGDFRESC